MYSKLLKVLLSRKRTRDRGGQIDRRAAGGPCLRDVSRQNRLRNHIVAGWQQVEGICTCRAGHRREKVRAVGDQLHCDSRQTRFTGVEDPVGIQIVELVPVDRISQHVAER